MPDVTEMDVAANQNMRLAVSAAVDFWVLKGTIE